MRLQSVRALPAAVSAKWRYLTWDLGERFSRGCAGRRVWAKTTGMKLRHIAVLTLVGWVLMVPHWVRPPYPKSRDGFWDFNAPLNQWDRRDYFDSQDACEAALKRDFMIRDPVTGDTSQCVYEGDPRLAK